MFPQKLVSVIIPSFNRDYLLSDAVRSVKRQTYQNIQIIVADDGSTDETRKLVESFGDVEYYYQENKGQGSARNLGLKNAKGDYITTLDSDDAWHETFIAESVRCLEENDLDFVFSNWIYEIDEVQFRSDWYRSGIWKKYRKNSFDKWFLLDSDEVRHLFIETCPAPSSALLIKRESLVSEWNEEMLIADDWCLILDMVLSTKCKAGFTLKPLWVKGIHNSNIYDGNEKIETIKKLGLHDENLLAVRFDSKLTDKEKNILRKRMAGHHFNLGFWSIKKWGFSKKSLNLILQSFLMAPLGILLLIFQRIWGKIGNIFSVNQLEAPKRAKL